MPDFHVGVDIGLCSHGADFKADGVIEAGIDFAAIDENRVSYDPESQVYSLALPAPEYTSCRVEYVRLQDNSLSFCNPDWDRVRIFAEVQAMAQFLKESDEKGLLQEAANRSAEVLEDFVHTLTGKPVNVDFDERIDKPKISDSCAPSVPDGWYYDDANQVWKKNSS
ncbi:MAG: DUF4230 domain-containing protein [Chloroflexi bacterium]|nr:DUF4230 domain-containing protein [Chloroflexota bacterium]